MVFRRRKKNKKQNPILGRVTSWSNDNPLGIEIHMNIDTSKIEEATKQTTEALKKFAESVADQAGSRQPVQTGALRGSPTFSSRDVDDAIRYTAKGVGLAVTMFWRDGVKVPSGALVNLNRSDGTLFVVRGFDEEEVCGHLQAGRSQSGIQTPSAIRWRPFKDRMYWCYQCNADGKTNVLVNSNDFTAITAKDADGLCVPCFDLDRDVQAVMQSMSITYGEAKEMILKAQVNVLRTPFDSNNDLSGLSAVMFPQCPHGLSSMAWCDECSNP